MCGLVLFCWLGVLSLVSTRCPVCSFFWLATFFPLLATVCRCGGALWDLVAFLVLGVVGGGLLMQWWASGCWVAQGGGVCASNAVLLDAG